MRPYIAILPTSFLQGRVLVVRVVQTSQHLHLDHVLVIDLGVRRGVSRQDCVVFAQLRLRLQSHGVCGDRFTLVLLQLVELLHVDNHMDFLYQEIFHFVQQFLFHGSVQCVTRHLVQSAQQLLGAAVQELIPHLRCVHAGLLLVSSPLKHEQIEFGRSGFLVLLASAAGTIGCVAAMWWVSNTAAAASPTSA